MASSFRPRNSVGSGGAGAGAGAGSKLNSSSNSQNGNGNQNGNLPTGGNSARFNNINPRQSLGNSANNPSNAANSNNGTSSPRWGLNASNSNSPNPHHQPQANPTAFPSLTSSSTGTVDTQALMRERMLFLIVSLVGHSVIAVVRGGTQYLGILNSASLETGELGIILSLAQEILPIPAGGSEPALGPLKPTLTILGSDLNQVQANHVKMGDSEKETKQARERDAFRTDTEISNSAFDALNGGRTLQKWSDDPGLAPIGGGKADSGLGGSSGSWDQFAVNEARFGTKTDFDEEMYTTKLDKSGKDFLERERRAEKLANEILNSSTSHPHIAEERNKVDESGQTEEARWSSVDRTVQAGDRNAYIPPARRAAAAAAAAKVNGAVTPSSAASPAPVAASVVAPDAAAAEAEKSSKKPNPTDTASLLSDFRGFAALEHRRLEEKKTALQKQEKETRVNDLKSWYSTFKLKTPVPEDLAGASSKGSMASDKPRDPSLKKSLSPTSAHIAAASQKTANTSSSKHLGADLASPQNRLSATPASAQPSSPNASARVATGTPVSAEKKALLAAMTLPKIPPFNPEKAKARQAGASSAAPPSISVSSSSNAAAEEARKSAAAAASFKFSAKASSFKPFNPNASSFKPGGSTAAASTSTQPAIPGVSEAVTSSGPVPSTPTLAAAPAALASSSTSATPPVPSNPFFGLRVPKKLISSTPFRLRDDFDPFKLSKVPEAGMVSSGWEFSGKPYRQLFSAFPPSAVNPSGAPAPQSQFDEGSPQAFHAGVGGPQPPHGNNSQPPIMHHSPHPANANGPAHYMQGQPQPFGMYAPHNQQFPFRPGQPPPQQGNQNPQQQQNSGPQQGQGQQGPPQMMPQMGPGGGYGNVPPPFMQMPFSPVPPHGVPGGMYSPQMANMAPPGQHGHFPMHQPSHSGPPVRPGQVPPHMQQKGGPAPMYYQPQPGPMPGMPYPGHFMPQGNVRPPMDGSQGPDQQQ